MAVEITGTALHLSPPRIPRGHHSPKSLASALSSLFGTTSPRYGPDHADAISYHIPYQSPFLEFGLFHHCQASEDLNRRRRERRGRRRASSSASPGGFFNDGENDEDKFLKGMSELALKFNFETEFQIEEAETSSHGTEVDSSISSSPSEAFHSTHPVSDANFPLPITGSSEMPPMFPDPWPNGDKFTAESLEWQASSDVLPLSLRILKKKKQWQAEELTDSVCSSVNKAFSYMVFIVRELQSHTIRMRGALFSYDKLQIQGILARVHDELHASFVWLFQRIFSATPTLMVCLMLLLANFIVNCITDQSITVAAAHPPPYSISTVTESHQTNRQTPPPRFDSSSIKSLSIGRSATIGGSRSGGGGGKASTIAGASDDGKTDRSLSSLRLDSADSPDALSTAATEEEDEARTWKGILEEAERMRANDRHEAIMDPETLRRFVSPVTEDFVPEDFSAYSGTETSYWRALADDSQNPLLLSNFARFLYLVLRDHDRAEEYFKKAAQAVPADAEALCRYANFLWVARKDLGAAEEAFLEAIAADPGNSYYSANYAHFLWSTGGEDTCYPLDGCDA